MDEDAPSPPPPPAAVPPRSLSAETGESLQTQINLAPQLAATRATWDPVYAELSRRLTREGLFGSPTEAGMLQLSEEAAPRVRALESGAATAQRTADITDVINLGPLAAQAFRAANPERTALMAALQKEALGAGASPLEAELNRQALEDLGLGGQLSPEEMRTATQAAREGFSARGMVLGRPAVLAEALNRNQFATARQAQRRGFAGNVEELSLRRRAADRGFLGNVAQLQSGTSFDPLMAILGRPTTATQAGQAQFGLASGVLGRMDSQKFDIFNPYAADLYNTNFNAAAARNIAEANLGASVYGANLQRSAADQAATYQLIGTGIQAASSMGGAAAMMCWVAEELFGKKSEKTKRIRKFMMNHLMDDSSLGQFARNYLEHGKQWARWARDNSSFRLEAFQLWSQFDRRAAAEGF